jgi:hypothetical protein
MKYARILSAAVHEVFTPPPGFELTDCFTSQIAAQFKPCDDEVQSGWLLQEDGSLIAPPPLPVPVEPIPAPEAPDNTPIN